MLSFCKAKYLQYDKIQKGKIHQLIKSSLGSKFCGVFFSLVTHLQAAECLT